MRFTYIVLLSTPQAVEYSSPVYTTGSRIYTSIPTTRLNMNFISHWVNEVEDSLRINTYM